MIYNEEAPSTPIRSTFEFHSNDSASSSYTASSTTSSTSSSNSPPRLNRKRKTYEICPLVDIQLCPEFLIPNLGIHDDDEEEARMPLLSTRSRSKFILKKRVTSNFQNFLDTVDMDNTDSMDSIDSTIPMRRGKVHRSVEIEGQSPQGVTAGFPDFPDLNAAPWAVRRAH